MNYKLKSTDGRVTFLFRAGKDYVRNEMPVEAAQHIIEKGMHVKSDRVDYPICIEKRWYFEGEEVVTHVRKKGGRKG